MIPINFPPPQLYALPSTLHYHPSPLSPLLFLIFPIYSPSQSVTLPPHFYHLNLPSLTQFSCPSPSILCRNVGSHWALEQAKYNLVNEYLLVGVTEELEDFVMMLEAALPRFFRGATELYKTGILQWTLITR